MIYVERMEDVQNLIECGICKRVEVDGESYFKMGSPMRINDKVSALFGQN